MSLLQNLWFNWILNPTISSALGADFTADNTTFTADTTAYTADTITI